MVLCRLGTGKSLHFPFILSPRDFMPIPDYQTLLLPLLNLAADEQEHAFRDALESLALEFKLTPAEQMELLPSGAQTVFSNRVGWARSYLKQAGLLHTPRRGFFALTQRGRQMLQHKPKRLQVSDLKQFAEFQAFRARKRPKALETLKATDFAPDLMLDNTPEDIMASAYRITQQNLAQEVLSLIKELPPTFFEKLVIDLLVKMGYGGNRQDAGRAIGKTGDGGIDGFINEDRLGLDVIYVQAKRWDTTVGRPEIQKFAGALQGQKGRKGIFITTSTFSREAKEYAHSIEIRLILIDGKRLAELMVEHNIGVTVLGLYEVKKIDLDYFEGI